jgi:outer membrane immunogenic protein
VISFRRAGGQSESQFIEGGWFVLLAKFIASYFRVTTQNPEPDSDGLRRLSATRERKLEAVLEAFSRVLGSLMSRSVKMISLVGCVLLASTTAFSADIASRPVYKAEPAPVQAWTGGYLGATVGYGWGESTSTIAAIDTQLIPFFQSQGVIPTSLHPAFKGFIGGGEVGYNWQVGRWVTGLEADFSYSALRGDVINYAPQVGAVPETLTSQSIELAWFGTVRARMGYLATPDVLLFATGGLAYGQVKVSTGLVPEPTTPCANNAICSVGSASDVRVGWTVGGGLETRIASKWTAKIEYLYFDLGNISDTAFSLSGNPAWRGLPIVGVTSDITGNIVRLGLNYQL